MQLEARKLFASLSNRQYHYSVGEIARYLNSSSQAVSALIKKGEKITQIKSN